MDPRERLELLDRVLEDLRLANQEAVVLVEGPNDERALRSLGLAGEIRVLHGPGTVLETADRIAESADAVVLLTDWDRTGGSLARRLRDNLAGRVRLDTGIRRRLARVCHVKCVEDVPAFRRHLRRQVSRP